MRKHIRNMFRAEGKKKKLKSSRWVRAAWEYFQDGKFGVAKRKINQARGTHKKSIWSSREALFASR